MSEEDSFSLMEQVIDFLYSDDYLPLKLTVNIPLSYFALIT